MPIYEYICLVCEHHFDALRSMRDADAPIDCTECHGDRTERLISLFAAHSEGRVVTGSAPNCSACNTHACSTCGIKPA